MRCQKKIIQTNKTKEKIIVICRGMKKAPSFEKGLGREVGKLKSSNYANCFLKIFLSFKHPKNISKKRQRNVKISKDQVAPTNLSRLG